MAHCHGSSFVYDEQKFISSCDNSVHSWVNELKNGKAQSCILLDTTDGIYGADQWLGCRPLLDSLISQIHSS